MAQLGPEQFDRTLDERIVVCPFSPTDTDDETAIAAFLAKQQLALTIQMHQDIISNEQ